MNDTLDTLDRVLATTPLTAQAENDSNPIGADRVLLDPAAEKLLARIARSFAQPVPKVGRDAAANIRLAFATLANDIESAAAEASERAKAVEDEARSYASVIRQAGEVLCSKIENEVTGTYRLSVALRELRKELGPAQPPAAETGG